MRPKNPEILHYEQTSSTHEGAILSDGDGADFHNPFRSAELRSLNEAQQIRADADARPRPERPLTPVEESGLRVGRSAVNTAILRSRTVGLTQADFELAAGE